MVVATVVLILVAVEVVHLINNSIQEQAVAVLLLLIGQQ
jgi:hypothetical protein